MGKLHAMCHPFCRSSGSAASTIASGGTTHFERLCSEDMVHTTSAQGLVAHVIATSNGRWGFSMQM
eukprot:5511295-Amphidinium_carterae.1